MNRILSALLLSAFALCASIAAQEKSDQAKPAPEPRAVSYGLVVDNSGSFRLLLDRVITVVSDVVDNNGADDEAFLVTFVSTPKIVLRQEFTDSKSELHDAANNMFIEGGHTAIIDAVKSSTVYLAENAKADESRSRALILVTDGEDRASETKIEDVLKLLKEHNIRVMVIAMSSEKVMMKIPERLAKETGGTVFTPKTKAELTAAAKAVSAAIRTK